MFANDALARPNAFELRGRYTKIMTRACNYGLNATTLPKKLEKKKSVSYQLDSIRKMNDSSV
jgi:hypothetical protein